MAFFDKIGDKAKGLVDSAKITYKVSEEKSKLSELYEHLGLLVWEAHQNLMPNRRQNLFPYLTGYARFMPPLKSLQQSFRALSPKINTNTNGNSDSNGECCCGSNDSSTEFAEDSFDNRSGDAANEYECSREDFHAVDGTIKCRAAAVRLISFPLSARAAAISFPPMTPQNPIVRQSVIALHAVPS